MGGGSSERSELTAGGLASDGLRVLWLLDVWVWVGVLGPGRAETPHDSTPAHIVTIAST